MVANLNFLPLAMTGLLKTAEDFFGDAEGEEGEISGSSSGVQFGSSSVSVVE